MTYNGVNQGPRTLNSLDRAFQDPTPELDDLVLYDVEGQLANLDGYDRRRPASLLTTNA